MAKQRKTSAKKLINSIEEIFSRPQKALTQRQKNNQKLLAILKQLTQKYPDWRFSQILWVGGFVTDDVDPVTDCGGWHDEFYVESDKILERVKKICAEKNLLNGLERAALKCKKDK